MGGPKQGPDEGGGEEVGQPHWPKHRGRLLVQ